MGKVSIRNKRGEKSRSKKNQYPSNGFKTHSERDKSLEGEHRGEAREKKGLPKRDIQGGIDQLSRVEGGGLRRESAPEGTPGWTKKRETINFRRKGEES